MFITRAISCNHAWNTFHEYAEESTSIKLAIAGLAYKHSPTNSFADAFVRTSGLTKQGFNLVPTVHISDEKPSLPITVLKRRGLSVAVLERNAGVREWMLWVRRTSKMNDGPECFVSICLEDGADKESSIGYVGACSVIEAAAFDCPVAALFVSEYPPTDEIKVRSVHVPSDLSLVDTTISRVIEFAPEHLQAGIGILTYFGSILKQKYPGLNARVRIEQQGLRVKMVVESPEGRIEEIEELLDRYGRVVHGELAPEAITTSALQVLELKNELRIAHMRLELSLDKIAFQQSSLDTLRLALLSSLSSPKAQISIDFRPELSASSNAVQSVSVSGAVSALSEVLGYLEQLLPPAESEVRARVLAIEQDVSSLKARDQADPKAKSTLERVRKFLDDGAKVGTSTNAVLSGIADGWELIQKIGRRYNDVAGWFGAPVIPSAIVGRD